MTCIVGIVKNKEVWIGGDSAGVSGLDVQHRKDTKVFQTGKFLIGYTSSFRMGQILRFKLEVEHQKKEQSDYEYMCTTFIDGVRVILNREGFAVHDQKQESIGTFLVGYQGRLYGVHNDMQIAELYDKFDSVGCGAKYALGALNILNNLTPQETIKKALETAVKFSGGVRPPFVILKGE